MRKLFSDNSLLGSADHEISQIVELVQQLPPDLRKEELERLQKLVEDFKRT